MYVEVNGNLEKALKIFNKKVKQAGIIQEVYRRREYTKPSKMKRLKREEAIKRNIRESRNRKK